MSRALVLAGGGVAGIAWELGAIDALRTAGVDITDADLIIGTSAGAAAGAQVATGELDRAVALQERAETAELSVELDMQAYMEQLVGLMGSVDSAAEAGRRLGQFAREAQTVPEADRKAAVAARLPAKEWPARPLRLVAVDAESGEMAVFDRDSGVELVDAVAASCAVPGIWPLVSIGDRKYMDGGARSGTNADLAAGAERVLVLIPTPPNELFDRQFAGEREALIGSQIHVLQADDEAAAAIGPNPLDPSRRAAALAAGRRQGKIAAEQIAKFWTT
jgi:NTE family protein